MFLVKEQGGRPESGDGGVYRMAEGGQAKGTEAKRRNEEDGEAQGAQSVLALLLEKTGVVGLTTACRPSVEEARGVVG